ncbi:MAG: retropepsin-like aspartic protease [Terriglobia bacterium]
MSSLFERLQAELTAGNIEAAEGTTAALDQAGDHEGAAVGTLVIARRRHDAGALRRISAGPAGELLRRDPERHLLLARTLRYTLGLAAAAPEFEALCARPENPQSHRALEHACAMARLARLGHPPQALEIHGVAEAPLEIQQGLATIKASLNGAAPQYFILDTGAPSSILNRAYCERAGLPRPTEAGRTAYDAAGNAFTLTPARVDRLSFGGLVIRNWLVEVANLYHNFQVAGVLSACDTFQGHAFELDFQRHVLRVATGAAEAGSRPSHPVNLAWDGGKCFVRASLNRVTRGWFLLDSGAAGILVTPALARVACPDRQDWESISSPVAAGRMEVFKGFQGILSVEGNDETESELTIAELRPDPDELLPLESQGVLGVPWMQGHRLFFPASRQQVLVSSGNPEAGI